MRAEDLGAYQTAVERRITPLTHAGWQAKRAFERFPGTTYAIARLPVTFRVLQKLLQGDLPDPAEARGIELAAIRAIYAVSRVAARATPNPAVRLAKMRSCRSRARGVSQSPMAGCR